MYQFFLHFFIYCGLYNKPSYARVLISSHLWSIGGQTYRIYGTIILYRWYNNWAMTSCHINSYIDPSLKFIEQIDSKLLCVCSVIDHRGRQNVVRTSVTHSAAPHVPLFCSYHILTSSVTYYWTDARQLWIYLFNKF